MNGGANFLAPVRVSDGVSDEDRADPDNNDYGDYTGIAAFGGSAFAVWGDNSNSTGDNPGGNATFDVYVDRVILTSTGGQIVTATGGGGVDTYVVQLDASGTFLQVWENDPTLAGLPDFVGTLAAISRIAVNTDGGADQLIVDFSNGNPIPTGGIDFDGGTEGDLLVLRNGTLASVAYAASGVGSGRVTADGRVVRYSNLEPVLDTTVAAARSFVMEIGGAQTVRIGDDGNAANGLSRIDDAGTAAFESITFANPTATLNVDAGDGADIVQLLALDPAFAAALTVLAGDGADQVSVLAAPAGSTVNAGPGDDAITVELAGLAGALTVAGGSETDSLLVNGTAGGETIAVTATSVTRGAQSVLYGGIESLTVDALGGADTLSLASGAATLLGGAGDDDFTVSGGSGVLRGGLDDDDFLVNAAAAGGLLLDGEAGSDHYVVNFGALAGVVNAADSGGGIFDDLVVNGTPGPDMIVIGALAVSRGTEQVSYSGMEALLVDAGAENDVITVNGTGTTTTVRGGTGDDSFVVNANGLFTLTLDGQDGSDTYSIALGGTLLGPVVINDTGGTGSDKLLIQGTPGDDVIILSNSGVVSGPNNVTFSGIEEFEVNAGDGDDIVDGFALTTIAVTMHGGNGDDRLTGGAKGDSLFGDAGDDDLIGNLGADYLDGGTGSDAMVGDQGVIGPHEVLDGSTETTLAIPSGKLQAVINRSGTVRRSVMLIDEQDGAADTLVGGDGDDYLHGGAGADSLDGGAGADALFGNAGDDTLAGGGDDDHLYGGSGNDHLSGDAGADISYGGDGDDTLVADSGGDRLIDWFGNFDQFVSPGPGKGAPAIIRSPSPWVRDFLLNLGAADGAANPNAELRIVIPGGPAQQSNSGR